MEENVVFLASKLFANGVNRRYLVIVIMLPLTVPAVNKQLFHVKITEQI